MKNNRMSEQGRVSGRLLVQQMSRYALGIGGPAVISALSTAIFTRLFDVQTYGLFTVALTTATLLVAFGGQWLQQPLGRYMTNADEDEANALLRASILGLSIVIAIAIIIATTIHFLGLMRNSPYQNFWIPGVLFFCIQLLFSCATVVIQARMDASFYSRQQIILAVCKLGFGLLLIWAVWHDSVMLFWGGILATFVVLPSALRRSGIWSQVTPLIDSYRDAWTSLKSMSRYGIPMMGWFVASNILSSSDRLVIAMYRGSGEAGIYGASFNLMNGTVGLVSAPVLAATWPFLMKAWGEGDVDNAGRWLGRIASAVLVGGALLTGAVALLANDIASLMLGPSFREGAKVMPIIVGGMVALAVANYAHKPFEFYKKIRWMVLIAVGAATSSLVLNIIFVPQFGYMASAWISFGSYTMYAGCTIISGRRLLSWKWDLPAIMFATCGILCGYYFGGVVLGVMEGYPSALRIATAGLVYLLCAALSLCVPFGRRIKAMVSARYQRSAT